MKRSMWSAPPASLSLSSGEVHVWRARLEQSSEIQERLWRKLDDDERARASRFHFEKHRRRFVVARGFLRTLLGGYLRVEPEAACFAYGPYGKPSRSEEHTSELQSHSFISYAVFCLK